MVSTADYTPLCRSVRNRPERPGIHFRIIPDTTGRVAQDRPPGTLPRPMVGGNTGWGDTLMIRIAILITADSRESELQ